MRALLSVLGSVALLLSLIGCAAKPPPPRSEPSPLLRSVIPSFESKTLTGNPFDSSQFWGHPVVVSFFAPQCRACEQTLIATQAVYSDVHDVTMIGVFDGDAPTAAQIATHYDLKFPVVVDHNKEIAHRYEVSERPKTFVADNQGRLVWVGGANLTEQALASAVDTVR